MLPHTDDKELSPVPSKQEIAASLATGNQPVQRRHFPFRSQSMGESKHGRYPGKDQHQLYQLIGLPLQLVVHTPMGSTDMDMLAWVFHSTPHQQLLLTTMYKEIVVARDLAVTFVNQERLVIT